MSSTATRRSRAALLLLLAVVLPVLVTAPARAQVNPFWDHYKVYYQNPPFVSPIPIPPVTLKDQFGQFTHQVLQLELFMNPVVKIHPPNTYSINDSITHYAWWSINPQPQALTVNVTNQFGDQTLNVYDGVYLLNPALKNQTGPLPVKNHYKAYNCLGAPINAPIGMVDQFDGWQATVLTPRWFLTPVDKQVGQPGTGQYYPIVDPNQHYVCYEFQPPDPTPYLATMYDQFAQGVHLNLYPGRYICVPTYKLGVTGAVKDTWGRLKLLYR